MKLKVQSMAKLHQYLYVNTFLVFNESFMFYRNAHLLPDTITS